MEGTEICYFQNLISAQTCRSVWKFREKINIDKNFLFALKYKCILGWAKFFFFFLKSAYGRGHNRCEITSKRCDIKVSATHFNFFNLQSLLKVCKFLIIFKNLKNFFFENYFYLYFDTKLPLTAWNLRGSSILHDWAQYSIFNPIVDFLEALKMHHFSWK